MCALQDAVLRKTTNWNATSVKSSKASAWVLRDRHQASQTNMEKKGWQWRLRGKISFCIQYVNIFIILKIISKENKGVLLSYHTVHRFWEGRDNSVTIVNGYGLDGPGIESRWERDFSQTSIPALGSTQPPVQWVPGLSRRYSGWGVVLTTYPLLVARSRKSTAIPLSRSRPSGLLRGTFTFTFTFISLLEHVQLTTARTVLRHLQICCWIQLNY
jgi:hypothetical protein